MKSSDIEQIDGTHEVIKALAKPSISGKISQNGNFEVSWEEVGSASQYNIYQCDKEDISTVPKITPNSKRVSR